MKNQFKILIADVFEPTLMDMFTKAKVDFDYAPFMDRSQIIACIDQYHGLILRSKTYIDKEIMDLGSNLLFIARGGSGMDNVDEDYASEKGIKCINAPEGNRNAVAEHTIGLILNLFTNCTKSNLEIADYQWDREGNRGVELSNTTIGIIGYGNVGSTLAKKLNALGCKVIAFDKYKNGFDSNEVKEVSLKELQKNATVISLHVPLTGETKFMVDEDFINKTQNPFYLINTSRGKVVQLEAVKKGLDRNKILGFGADVIENENIMELNPKEKQLFDNLKNRTNCLFTPHVAGWTKESYVGISTVLAEKIINMLMNSEFFAKEILINLKN